MDYHHFLHAEFIDGHKERTYGRIHVRQDQSTGVFYDFRISVPEPQGLGKQFSEAGIHAGQYGKSLCRELVGDERFVRLVFDESLVVKED